MNEKQMAEIDKLYQDISTQDQTKETIEMSTKKVQDFWDKGWAA